MSHPVVERVLSGGVPDNVRLTAARGLLPIPREDQLELWACLRNDPDPDVRLACRENLALVDSDEWRALLPDGDFRLEFFDFAAKTLARSEDLAEALLRNRHLPDRHLMSLAGAAPAALLDRILDNQSRLLACPNVVVSLLENPALNATLARRIFDMAEQFFRDHSRIPALLEQRFQFRIGHAGGAFEAGAPAPAKAPAPAVKAPAGAAAPAAPPQQVSAPAMGTEVESAELTAEELTGEGAEEEIRTLYQRLLTMSVPEKISLAVKGNKEARGLLIRDSNKVVQEAVLDSPKMTEGEVENIAKMRNLSEEILRKIARNQDWMKQYGIVKAMVSNPKAPIGVTLGLVKRLNDFDMKNLLRDKNVSEAIRREAKKIYEIRMTPKKSALDKKKK